MAMRSLVFVHGASHGSWCWELLRPHLATPFLALDLPGRGTFARDPSEIELSDWVDHVCRAITGADLRDVVLVGHSLAGITLPRVVDRIPDRIAHLVFVACAVPAQGESVADLVLAGEAPGRSIPTPPAPFAQRMFCNDMDERQTRFVVEHLCPEAGGPFVEPMDLAGLAHPIPRTYVKLLQDQSPLTPDVQDRIIARLEPVEVEILDAGHDVMISRPASLAPILNERARRPT